MYITEHDKDVSEHNANKMGSKKINYSPSVGSCKPNRFVTNKEQCIKLQKEFDCVKKQNFEIPGCSQCFQDGTFQYLDKDSVTFNSTTLVLAGNGSVSITKLSSHENVKLTLSSSPSNVNLSSFMEGDSLQLDFTTASSYIAGYISGNTASGTFNLDINQIISTDLVTNSKPHLTGSFQINGGSYIVIRPGVGKTTMSLVLTNPFTFIDTNQEEASLCPASPYIGKQQSAQLLESSPCYAKGQAPGKYSQECVQSIFDSAGCTSKGTAYPSNNELTKAASYDKNGNPLTIGGIANNVYTIYKTATTGQDNNGQSIPINDWDTASMACLGIHKTSVCDKYDKINGPLGADCLNYLWQNSGASDRIPLGIGPTYTGSTNSASLQAKRGNRFCTADGLLAPIDKNGIVNESAVQAAQDQRHGVDAVKAFYNQISAKANDNTLSNEVRKPFIQQCYGISLDSREQQAQQITNPKSVIDYSPGRTKTEFVRSPNINIVEATYGINCSGNLRGNRTQLFKNLTNGKSSFDYTYNYQQTGGDPAFGCGKTLEIIYNCGDNQNQTYTVPPEAGIGGKISISC